MTEKKNENAGQDALNLKDGDSQEKVQDQVSAEKTEESSESLKEEAVDEQPDKNLGTNEVNGNETSSQTDANSR